MSYWTFLLLALAFAIGAPMLIWGMECAAALLFPVRKAEQVMRSRPTVTVLIPAHNEARGFGALWKASVASPCRRCDRRSRRQLY